MDCFKDLVGVKGFCTEELSVSTSELWLNNLSGFPGLAIADASINEDTQSAFDLIKQCLESAKKEIAIHFRNHLESTYKLKSIIENGTAGVYDERKKTMNPISGSFKGIKLEIKNRPYFKFSLSGISLNVDYAGVVNILVYDLITGNLLDTLPITAVSGQTVRIQPNKEYSNNGQPLSLFIGYNDQVTSLKTTIKSACCGQGQPGDSYFSSASIPTASQKIRENIKSASDTGGLSLSYSVDCTIDPFLCNSARKFDWALVHKWGANLMAEAVRSRRLHTLINVDKQDNQTLYDAYNAEYSASMNAILTNLAVPDDWCFKCNPRVKKVLQIP